MNEVGECQEIYKIEERYKIIKFIQFFFKIEMRVVDN